jgi:serine protease AprX
MSNGVLALEGWIFGSPEERRFTQESPVLPEVWIRFGEDPTARQDLLLTPHKDSTAAELLAALTAGGVGRVRGDDPGLACNEGYVVARLDYRQLVRWVLPLSPWWTRIWPPRARKLDAWVRRSGRPPAKSRRGAEAGFRLDWLLWLVQLLGRIQIEEFWRAKGERDEPRGPLDRDELGDEFAVIGSRLLQGLQRPRPGDPTPLWSVSVNREARTALSRSRLAVKADAAERVFAIGCEDLRWAIVDTGVDATHRAFRRRDRQGKLSDGSPGTSRVVATYDFTRLRSVVSDAEGGLSADQRAEIKHRVELGRALDWDAVAPLLAVPHDSDYLPPIPDHGTHVAGIVAADWRSADDPEMPIEDDLLGICPDIELYDLRVFDANGAGDEFAVSAALQFVRHLNSHSDLQVIHGVNLSLSLDHDLANYAVGRTPICDECERLTASGVLVAVAAGNDGQARYTSAGGQRDGFRTVAITDPGNAEEVITVGSTHRQDPHTYGVSYFSSRGPTGDGRAKPDLVAPGEKIKSPVPAGGYRVKDGTSQATAHVSGVAAMLMARNPELTGQPRRIKEILCGTATDLGRERYFQGAGLIDALRALQEV